MNKRISLQQNLINHVGFVLDGSASMRGNERELIAVADDLIAFLKEKSQERNQETRATMYIFSRDSQVACYDIDVLRTPSIASLYEATGGGTALIDATMLAIEEMRKTAILHGDHAFLLYVLTDGEENSSSRRPHELQRMLENLPDNWTAAALVPDRMGQSTAVNYGFSIENTKIWDATSKAGVIEIGREIRQATDNYMVARSQGVRGTRSLFTLNTTNLTPSVVQQNAQKLSSNEFVFVPVNKTGPIKEVVESALGSYTIGHTYYQLTKSEEIQPQKELAIRDKNTGEVYSGHGVRHMLGLPDAYVKVSPSSHRYFDIFVQSTSVNRKLLQGTEALVLR